MNSHAPHDKTVWQKAQSSLSKNDELKLVFLANALVCVFVLDYLFFVGDVLRYRQIRLCVLKEFTIE